MTLITYGHSLQKSQIQATMQPFRTLNHLPCKNWNPYEVEKHFLSPLKPDYPAHLHTESIQFTMYFFEKTLHAFKYIVAAATMCSWHANVYKKFLMMVAGVAIVLFVLHNLWLTSMTESRTERLCLLLYHLYILYPAIVCVCEGRGDPACNHHVAKHCTCFEDVIGTNTTTVLCNKT